MQYKWEQLETSASFSLHGGNVTLQYSNLFVTDFHVSLLHPWHVHHGFFETNLLLIILMILTRLVIASDVVHVQLF